MAKAILISIRPEHVAKILNKKKTIEIRKKFPKDYVGWVYIYCTKNKPRAILTDKGCVVANTLAVGGNSQYKSGYSLSGKVVARFWCDKVEEHRPFFHWCIEKETCLTRDDVLDYLDSKDKSVGNPKRQGKVYAIHITNLEIFDKPKELTAFKVRKNDCPFPCAACDVPYCKLKRPPQSWQFIEV